MQTDTRAQHDLIRGKDVYCIPNIQLDHFVVLRLSQSLMLLLLPARIIRVLVVRARVVATLLLLLLAAAASIRRILFAFILAAVGLTSIVFMLDTNV